MGKKVILYIAMSFDGFIADRNGGVDFLLDYHDTNESQGYNKFMNSIGSIIMGNKTYQQLVNKLSVGNWPYKEKNTYVYSRSETKKVDNDIIFTKLPAERLLSDIKSKHNGNIWLLGGANIIQPFLEKNLIDEYYIWIIPTLLGSGIPLFQVAHPKVNLKIRSTRRLGNVIEVIYVKK